MDAKDAKEGRKVGKKEGRERESFSLTVITLTVCVINNVVFEYQNQVIFNMTVFDGGPSLSYWHLRLVSNKKHRFWNTKSKSFFNMTLFEGGSRCQTNI